MPAKNPRLTITLQPSLAAQLRKLSELTGNSQSGLIGDLLEGSGPVFDRMIQVLEAAKTAKQAMKGKLAENMEQAQTQMEQGLGMVLEGFDDITVSLLDEAEAVTRRGRAAGKRSAARPGIGAVAPTPISNRGVRYDPKATKTIAQSRVSVRPKADKLGAKIRGATLKGPKPDDLMQILFDQVGLAAGFSKTRGFHTFGERMAIKDGGGHEFGSIQWGGRQGDRLMFEVKGEHSQKAAEALRARFEHRVTRVDACADFDAPGAFEALLGPSIEVKKERRIMGGKAGDWDDFPEKGRTLYLGSQSSPVRMRLYEKGLQPEYAHLKRPDWARIEVQVRPAKEAKDTFSSLSPMEVWGASRWTRDIAAKVLQQHVEPHPAGTTYRLTDRETALRWMCKQYGQHLASLAQDLGGWDCVGLTLQETMAAQAKGR